MNIRNNKPNYKKGARRQVTYCLLLNGVLPAKSIHLLPGNTETAYRKVLDMISEGVLSKKKSQDVWLVTFKAFTKDLAATLTKDFPKELIDIYYTYGRECAVRSRHTEKKISIPKPNEFIASYSFEDIDDSDFKEYHEESDVNKPKPLTKEEIQSLKAKKERNAQSKRTPLRRAVRNAETFLFISDLPVEYELDKKPLLSSSSDTPFENIFFTPYEVSLGASSYKEKFKSYKFVGSRENGVIISDGGSYVIYNSSNWGMEPSKGFEQNLVSYLDSILLNHQMPYVDGCIRLYGNDNILLSLMDANSIRIGNKVIRQNPDWVTNIEDHYENVYAIPLTKEGQKLASLMCCPNWKTTITRAFYAALKDGHKNCRIELHLETLKHTNNDGLMYYYALDSNECHHRTITLHFFIPNLKKLRYFISAIKRRGEYTEDGKFVPDELYEIYCFDFHAPAIKAYAGKYATIKSVSFKRFLEELSKLNFH